MFKKIIISETRRTAQKLISLSFLRLVDTPHKVAKVMGALSPKQQDFRRSISRRPPKDPTTSATLWASYGGKTASPKKERKIHFCSAPRTPVGEARVFC